MWPRQMCASTTLEALLGCLAAWTFLAALWLVYLFYVLLTYARKCANQHMSSKQSVADVRKAFARVCAL